MYKQNRFLLIAVLATSFFLSHCCAESQSLFKQADIFAQKAEKNTYKTTLDNGLMIVVYPKKDVPDVYMQLVYKVGSAHETTENTYGFAHLLEHMSFKGTNKDGLNLSETDIMEIGKKMHLTGLNANTSYDRTLYFFHADTSNWKVFLNVLADWMGNLRIEEQHLNSEMNAVYQEIKMRDQDSSGDVLAELMPYGHPYSHPIIGYKENILRSSAHDVRWFYKQFYAPNNAALIIVGNIEPEAAVEQAKKCFGHYQRSDYDLASAVDANGHKRIPSKSDFSRKDCIIYKEIPKKSVSCLWTIPGIADDSFLTASCIASVLDERLGRKLYDEHKAVLGIGAGCWPLVLDSVFSIHFTPHDTAFPVDQEKGVTRVINEADTVDFCLKTIVEEINDIIENGLLGEELERFKRVVVSQFVQSFESVSALGREFLHAYLKDELQGPIFDVSQELAKITNESIKSVAYKYLRPFLMNKMVVLPVPEEEKRNWVALRRSVDMHDYALMQQRVRTEPLESHRYVNKLEEPAPLPFTFKHPDRTITLANGLKVYLKRNDTIPFVNVGLGFYDVEQRSLDYSMKGLSAIPRFAMRQLFEGSEGYSKKDHEEFFDNYGASWYFVTSGAGFSCFKSDLDIVGKRFFHILTAPTFPEDVFQARCSDAIVVIRMNQQKPFEVESRLMSNHLYAQYPWIKSDDEKIAELESHSRSDLVNYHNEVVVPANMFCVVVGDYDDAKIESQLHTAFGGWTKESRATTEHVSVPELSNPAPKKLTSFLPQDQVVISLARVTTDSESDDYKCLALLKEHLQNETFSVRERTGIFYGCWTDLTCGATPLKKGCAYVTTQVAPGNVEKVQELLRNVLQSIADHGITQHELNRMKNSLQHNLARSFMTAKQQGFAYASLVSDGHDFNRYEKRLAQFQAITLEQVNAAAKKYLDPCQWSVCLVGRVGE